MKISCPNCQTNKYIKKILYGMPSDDFDFEKFEVGGCIPSDATMLCSKCEWENGKEELGVLGTGEN